MSEQTVPVISQDLEDEAWHDAYGIAYVGASNPVACAG